MNCTAKYDLRKAIGNFPKDHEFYNLLVGPCTVEVTNVGMTGELTHPIVCIANDLVIELDKTGRLYYGTGGCILYPSETEDWDKYLSDDLPCNTIMMVSNDMKTWELAFYIKEGYCSGSKLPEEKPNKLDGRSYAYEVPADKFDWEMKWIDINSGDNYGVSSLRYNRHYKIPSL